jgi:hypothetical protein
VAEISVEAAGDVAGFAHGEHMHYFHIMQEATFPAQVNQSIEQVLRFGTTRPQENPAAATYFRNCIASGH